MPFTPSPLVYEPSLNDLKASTQGFIFSKKQLDELGLSGKQKSWFDNIKIMDVEDGDSVNIAAYFRLIIPIKPPEKILGFLEKELHKCLEVREFVKADNLFNKLIDSFIYKFYLTQATNIIVETHDTNNAFLHYQFCRLYESNSELKQPKLSLFKKLGYNAILRKAVNARAKFYRKNVEAVRELLYPSYPDYEPPTNPREWIRRIDKIRQEYEREKVDF